MEGFNIVHEAGHQHAGDGRLHRHLEKWLRSSELVGPKAARSHASNVRFGSKADIRARVGDVRFTPKSGHDAGSKMPPS